MWCALADRKREHPALHTGVVKLEEGFGEGNALYRYEHGEDEQAIRGGAAPASEDAGACRDVRIVRRALRGHGRIVESSWTR